MDSLEDPKEIRDPKALLGMRHRDPQALLVSTAKTGSMDVMGCPAQSLGQQAPVAPRVARAQQETMEAQDLLALLVPLGTLVLPVSLARLVQLGTLVRLAPKASLVCQALLDHLARLALSELRARLDAQDRPGKLAFSEPWVLLEVPDQPG